RYPRPDADSIAHRRCSNRDAQSKNRSHCFFDDRTLSSASELSLRSIATAVCDPLCGSTPINTNVMTECLSVEVDPRRALLMTTSAFASYEPRRGPSASRLPVRSTAKPEDRQAHIKPTPQPP